MENIEWAAKICDISQYQEENNLLFNFAISSMKNNKYDFCLDAPFSPGHKYMLNSNTREFSLDFSILDSIYAWNQENFSIRVVSENAFYNEKTIYAVNEVANLDFIDEIEINLDVENELNLNNLSDKIKINTYSFSNLSANYLVFDGNEIFSVKGNPRYIVENQSAKITDYKNYEASLRNIVQYFWENSNRVWSGDDFWMYSNAYRPLCFRYDGVIIPHHRMNTAVCESGHLLEDASIISKNIEMFIAIFLVDKNNSANCYNCPMAPSCKRICFGEQYEKTKDFFIASPIDCQRQHFRLAILNKIYYELGDIYEQGNNFRVPK